MVDWEGGTTPRTDGGVKMILIVALEQVTCEGGWMAGRLNRFFSEVMHNASRANHWNPNRVNFIVTSCDVTPKKCFSNTR